MKDSSKIIIAFIILVIIVIGAFFLARPVKAPQVSPVSTSVEVAPLVTENASTTYTTLKLTYPKSSSTQYPEIFNFVTTTKADFLKQYGSLSAKDAVDMGFRPGLTYDLQMETKIATSTKTVSYIIDTYQFTGGAHGNTTVNTFTYDVSGRLITLDKVFTKEYLPTISRHAWDYLHAQIDKEYVQDGAITEGTAPKAENYSSWYLTNDTITFIFGQYQVGPYVIGIQEFPLPKSDVANILNPEFK